MAGRKKYVDDGTAERLFAYRSPGELGGVGTPIEGMALGRLGPDGLVRMDGRAVPFGQLSPAPPVPRPGKIVCIGLNYRDHVAEGGRETPDRPLIFSKFSNAVVADGEPVIRPAGSHALTSKASWAS